MDVIERILFKLILSGEAKGRIDRIEMVFEREYLEGEGNQATNELVRSFKEDVELFESRMSLVASGLKSVAI